MPEFGTKTPYLGSLKRYVMPEGRGRLANFVTNRYRN